MILSSNFKNKRKIVKNEGKEKIEDYLLKTFQKEDVERLFSHQLHDFSKKLIEFEEGKISFSKLKKEIHKITFFLYQNIPTTEVKKFEDKNIFGEGYSSNIFLINQNTIGKKIYKKKDDLIKFMPHQILYETFFESMIQYYLYESSQVRCVPKLIQYQKTGPESVLISMKKINGDTLLKNLLEKGDDKKWLKKTLSYIALLLEYLQRTFYFIHGDFHSKNVMITPQHKIYLIDFGFSSLKMNNQWITTKPNKFKIQYLPKNSINFSKSMDLFTMFLHFFKDEENRKYQNQLKAFFQLYDLLFRIKDIHLGELFFEYQKKWDEREKTREYNFIHVNLKDIENVYRFIDKVKKEDSKYNIITNDDIHTIRRRFEPLHFYKIVEKVLS